jgi:hypothetical protein
VNVVGSTAKSAEAKRFFFLKKKAFFILGSQKSSAISASAAIKQKEIGEAAKVVLVLLFTLLYTFAAYYQPATSMFVYHSCPLISTVCGQCTKPP